MQNSRAYPNPLQNRTIHTPAMQSKGAATSTPSKSSKRGQGQSTHDFTVYTDRRGRHSRFDNNRRMWYGSMDDSGILEPMPINEQTDEPNESESAVAGGGLENGGEDYWQPETEDEALAREETDVRETYTAAYRFRNEERRNGIETSAADIQD